MQRGLKGRCVITASSGCACERVDHECRRGQPDDLLYATYLGGSGYDYGSAIAVSGAENAYVVGQTSSTDFPTTAGVYDRTLHSNEAFVVKLNASGSGLEYATYMGGSDLDYGYGIAVDSLGHVYVTE